MTLDMSSNSARARATSGNRQEASQQVEPTTGEASSPFAQDTVQDRRPSGNFDERIANGLKQGLGIVRMIRQSTDKQVRRALGSREEQLDQIRYVREYGIDEGHKRLITVDREKGDRGTRTVRKDGTVTERETFEELMDHLESGRIFLLIVYSIARLARDEEDGARLVSVMKRRNILLMVNGRLLDIYDKDDSFRIHFDILMAARDAAERAEIGMSGKYKKAKRGALSQILPSGLVRAYPRDPIFIERMKQCGLEHLITPEALATHKYARVDPEGRSYYVLPLPDPAVRAAQSCIIQWAREAKSLTGLARRIRAGGAGWPAGDEYKGCVPVMRDTIWRPEVEATWRPVSAAFLRQWLSRPALYGAFAYNTPALAKVMAKRDPHEPYEVFLTNQFPSLMTTEDWPAIERLLARPDRHHAKDSRRRRGARQFKGARVHALPWVVCGGADGSCEHKGGYVYREDGAYVYTFMECAMKRGHRWAVSPAIEAVALRGLEAVFTPDVIAEGLSQLEVMDDGVKQQLAQLSSQRAARAREAVAARKNASRVDHEDETLAAAFLADAKEAHLALGAIDAQIALLRERSANTLKLEASERAQILTAAGDFPRVLTLAARADRLVRSAMADAAENGDLPELERLERYEGQVRQLVRAAGLVVRVDMHADAERATVVVRFPGGAETSETIDAYYTPGPQAQRVWMLEQHQAGREPEEIALRLDSMFPKRYPLARTFPAWSASTVRAALEYHAMYEHIRTPLEDQATMSVADLAERSGESEETVLLAVLRGQLGRARLGGDGTLKVEATPRLVTRAFIGYARRAIAADRGWPVEETATIAEIVRNGRGAKEAINDENRYATLARMAGELAVDDAARLWTLRSLNLTSADQACGYRLSKHPDYAHLDPSMWMTMDTARREFPTCDYSTIRDNALFVQIRAPGVHRTVVWIGPKERQRFTIVSLSAAVAELARTTSRAFKPEDFMLVTDIGAWAEKGRWVKPVEMIRYAWESERITIVRAQAPSGRGRRRIWAYVPPSLRAKPTQSALERWLSGVDPQLPAACKVMPENPNVVGGLSG